MKQLLTSVRSRAILLGVLCLVALGWNMALSTARRSSSGSLQKAVKQDLVISVACPGKIEPKFEEMLRSEIDGKKKAVYKNEGDTVKKGDLLMEISDDRIRMELSQKKSTYQNAEADMVKARRDYQLEKSLYKQQAVPLREVETARLAYERSVQSYELAKQEFKLMDQKAKGVRVISPMDGIVLKNYVDREDYITAGKDLIKIARLDDYVVRGRVDELDIANLNVGQTATIRCDAYPGIIFPGKVQWIGAQAADGAFAEIEVTIEITDDKDQQLKPGLTAEATIISGQLKDATLVPARAVRQGPNGAYVYKAGVGGWLQEQPVKVAAPVMSGMAAIESGIAPGDAVMVPEEE